MKTSNQNNESENLYEFSTVVISKDDQNSTYQCIPKLIMESNPLTVGNIYNSVKLNGISIDSVIPHPMILDTYIKKNLRGLELTMKGIGHLLEPVKVIRKDEVYLIFDGISRYYAALNLGWDKIDIELFELTEPEIQNQAVLRGIVTKRTLWEECNRIELFLNILGKSQGKKRETLGDFESPDETNFGLVGKDRFQIACEIAGVPFSSVTLRKLIAVKHFIESGDEETRNLNLWEGLESGELKANSAYNQMINYMKTKSEEGKNELTETLEKISSGNYQLYNSDCEDLTELEDESIDCCISSPPYWQQRHYPLENLKKQLGHEDSVDEYVVNQVSIFKGLLPKLKDTGSLFIVISDSFQDKKNCLVIEKFILRMVESGWTLIQKWPWVKSNPKPQSNIKRLIHSYEMIIHFVKNKDTYYWRELITWKPDGHYKVIKGCNDHSLGSKSKKKSFTLSKPIERITSFLEEQKVEGILKTNGFDWNELKEIDPNFRHEAPFPSLIPVLPILMTTQIGNTVLDIYNGTGTTTSIARLLGRKAVGIDVDSKAHDFAGKRMEMIEQHLPSIEEVTQLENDFLEPAA